jgi:peptidoglycan/LPS O-acetylase OafA/YrhL
LPTFFTGLARVSFSFFTGVAISGILTRKRIAELPSVSFPILSVALLAVFFAGFWFGPLYDVTAVLVIFPGLALLATKDCIGQRWRIFALWAGQISYPLYVLHTVVVHEGEFRNESTALMAIRFFCLFLGDVVVAYAALRLFDQPLRKWIGRQRRKAVSADSALGGGVAGSD